MASSPVSKKLRIVEDENYELRTKLFENAKLLERLIFVEAVRKPEQDRLQSDIDENIQNISHYKEETKKYQKMAEEEQRKMDSMKSMEGLAEASKAKNEEILQLELKLSDLLEEKEKYIRRSGGRI